MQNQTLIRLLSGFTAALTLGLCGCAVPQEEPPVSAGRQTAVAAPISGDAQLPSAPAVQETEKSDTNAEGVTLNILDFGAYADGKKDDLPAFRSGIEAVLQAGGGTLYIPAGTYRISETLELTGDDDAPLTLRADPTGKTFIVSDTSLDGPSLYVERSGVTLYGLDVRNKSTKDNAAIVVTGSHNTLDTVTARMTNGNTKPGFLVYGSYNTIKNCGVGYVSSTQYQMVFSKMEGAESVGNVLEDCHFGGQASKCVLVTSEDAAGAPEKMIIRRNVFLVVACDQVEVQAARDLYITDNMLDAAGVCVLLDPIAAGINGLQMTNNYCGASTGGDRTSGLRTEANYGGSIVSVIVSANYFWAPNAVRVVDPGYTCFKLTDNYFVLTGGDAIYMEAAVSAYLEGNIVTNVGGNRSLCINTVDDETVIQNNTFGNEVEVPDWRERFRKQNVI